MGHDIKERLTPWDCGQGDGGVAGVLIPLQWNVRHLQLLVDGCMMVERIGELEAR